MYIVSLKDRHRVLKKAVTQSEKGKEDGQFFTKRILLLLATLVSVPLLSGCWDRVEVNDLAIVTAAAIDKKDDNQIELSNPNIYSKNLKQWGR